MTQIAKTVFGIYVIEHGDVVEREEYDADTAVDMLQSRQPLEEVHADAEVYVPSVDELAAWADTEVEQVVSRQHAVGIELVKQQISASGTRDQLLVQAVRALDDINETNNELAERLRPWYALHFPELEAAISDHDEFARRVAEHADRDVVETDIDPGKSTGMPLQEKDVAMLERFAAHLDDAHRLREELEAYVTDVATVVVPNLSAVLGELLAARILSLAGSLEKLAKMPSSTIQVLGAEKAMFRYMHGEGSAPKHGVLFMHPHVQQAPDDRRGEMARVIANKAAIAARLDHFGGDFKGDELRGEVDEKFAEVTG